MSVGTLSSRETVVEIGDSVRGRDVFILQTGTKYELIQAIYAYKGLLVVFDLPEQATLLMLLEILTSY